MRTLILSAVLVVFSGAVAAAQAPTLRYDWKPDQTFAYRTTIVVEMPDKIDTYQGVTTYTVKSVEKENRLVVYQGGLAKTSKAKETERPRGFGPPRFGFPGGPPSPFSRNNFRGTDQTTNEITISPVGNVSQLKGDSQLPYLLGNVSLLPFEPLPGTALKEWKNESGTSITERPERSEDRFPRFGRFGPVQSDGEHEVQAASETTSFKVTGEAAGIVTVAKTYTLKSPPPKAGEQGFELSGSGTWKFDTKLNVSDSLHMEQKLTIAGNNQQVLVPITIDYKRLTDEELAKVTEERKAAADALRAKHEETIKARAEEQRITETPLTEDAKQAAVAVLKGSDKVQQVKTLAALAKKNLANPDEEIAMAIEPLLKHADRPVREAAHQALIKWSLSYRPRGEIDAQYAGMHGVSPSARPVTADTPLYVGQIVQLKENNRWVAADILELQSDGKVKVHPRGWNTTAWDKAAGRELLQLAPEELFQPAKSPTASATSVAAELRTWTDKTGTHKIEAVYQGVSEGKVVLKRKDNRELKVALDSLSKADQDHVAQLQKAAETPPNPFEQ